MSSLQRIALLAFLCCPVFGQSHELAVSGGYNYQNSDQGNGVRANLHGWFASVQVDLNRRTAVYVRFRRSEDPSFLLCASRRPALCFGQKR
jgi:hypothetical protein